MESVDMNKTCNECNRSLPMTIEYFHRRTSAKDGFNTRCKECRGSAFGIIHPNRVLDAPEGHKYCTKCLELKLFNDFAKSSKEKDGYVQVCKKCRHKYYKDNFEHFAQKGREYNQINKEEKQQYKAEYYLKNKERLSKEQKEYYELNKQQIMDRQRDYYFENKEAIQAYKKEHNKMYAPKYADIRRNRYFENHEANLKKRNQYRIDNAEKIKASRRTEHGKELMRYHKQKRKSLKKQLPANYGINEWNSCKAHFDNQCAYCGEVKPLEQEHFIPLTKSGEYTINNIICACRNCNSSKGNKDFFEWYPKRKSYSKQREQKILKYLNYNNKTQQLALL